MSLKSDLYCLEKFPELLRLLQRATAAASRRFAVRCSRMFVQAAGPHGEASIDEALALADWLAGGGNAGDERVGRIRERALATVKRLDKLQLDIAELNEQADVAGLQPWCGGQRRAFCAYVAADAAAMALTEDAREAAAAVAVDIVDAVDAIDAREYLSIGRSEILALAEETLVAD